MSDDHTRVRQVRVPDGIWAAYGRVCSKLGVNRAGDLVDHMRARIREHGSEEDIADLDRAEEELAERRSRKGGRPPKGRAEGQADDG
ncbi:hypothetical protein [Actinomadura rupiterrae]|uniref:hypothetical protein n=1 Tax=Actinomadura rupiterrae TaxID=559627 RepID=UPI0020A32A0F|nr:hypothetical protein [Actinomadura rupiterrae]MCP2336118.1 hypothetical protein [Actinomadura rupiterrae]